MAEHTVILSGYVALAVAAVVLAFQAWRTSHPDSTLGAYLTAVMSRPVGRWLILLLWLWVGWHFFVR
jgi:Family of unknown function (DUF6186)